MEILTDLSTAFELEEQKPVLAFLPVGATEQHSRHLPIATDTLLGERLSGEILSRVPRPGRALLLRTLPFSSSAENSGFRGTVNFTPLTMRSVVRDACTSLARDGISTLVVCAWHGGNFILKPVIRELNLELGRCGVIYLNPWEQVPASVYAGVAPGFEVHCGEIETSLMLHLLPETVRSDRRDNPVPFQAPWQDMFSMKTLSGGEGHAGHPTRATADKGRAFAEAVITHSARALTGLLAMADRFDHY